MFYLKCVKCNVSNRCLAPLKDIVPERPFTKKASQKVRISEPKTPHGIPERPYNIFIIIE
jgi:hypothetical protein